MQIKYSIIIPHYNSLTLLKRCINSIPRRSDVEIIIIDDNSKVSETPSNMVFQNRNIRIFLLKNNRGAGYARNLGVKKSLGHWVLFVDADDYFVNNAFETFDKSIDDIVYSDIIYFKAESRYSDTGLIADRDKFVNSLIDCYNPEENDIQLRVKHLVPWGKVFSSKFVKESGIEFDCIVVANDVMFNVKAGFYASKICVVPKIVYCVTMGKGSLTNTLNKNNNRTRLNVALKYNSFLRNKNLSPYQTSLRPYLRNAIKFGPLEAIYCLKMIRKLGGSIFFNLNIKRSIITFLSIKEKETKNKSFIKK